MKLSKTQAEFCSRHNLTEAQFRGTETVGDSLDLSCLTSIPKGFNPTVGGSLDLRSLTSIPKGFNPTVGGSLDLRSLTSIPQGFNPTVGGYLDLRSLTSIPQGFNPTVGGDLYLSSLTSIPKGFNPTVGDSLYLGSLTSIPQGFNPTVGDYLYLHSGLSAPTTKPKGILNTPKNKLLFWKEGKYVKADGMFTEVVSKKGNSYLVKKLNSLKEFYLVTDGDRTHAHGDTLQQAKKDFRFKKMAEKLKNEPIKPDTIISINHYRLITGACELGVKSWMQANGIIKDEIKASDLLPLLEKSNAYGLDKFKSLITF